MSVCLFYHDRREFSSQRPFSLLLSFRAKFTERRGKTIQFEIDRVCSCAGCADSRLSRARELAYAARARPSAPQLQQTLLAGRRPRVCTSRLAAGLLVATSCAQLWRRMHVLTTSPRRGRSWCSARAHFGAPPPRALRPTTSPYSRCACPICPPPRACPMRVL